MNTNITQKYSLNHQGVEQKKGTEKKIQKQPEYNQHSSNNYIPINNYFKCM